MEDRREKEEGGGEGWKELLQVQMKRDRNEETKGR